MMKIEIDGSIRRAMNGKLRYLVLLDGQRIWFTLKSFYVMAALVHARHYHDGGWLPSIILRRHGMRIDLVKTEFAQGFLDTYGMIIDHQIKGHRLCNSVTSTTIDWRNLINIDFQPLVDIASMWKQRNQKELF